MHRIEFLVKRVMRVLVARYANASAGGVRSSLLRNALFALFIVGILAYGATLAWHRLTSFDLVNLIFGDFADDAFYYFQIAHHLSEGRFSTFDGGVTRTNGYHPLWLLMITPLYWFFDKEEALFAVKALEIALIAGGTALIVAAARLARLPWILLFATPPLLYQRRALLLGLEAAAGLFTLGLLFLAVCLYARDSARWKWPLAAVAFVLPWARTEYVAISLAVTGALCLIEWSWRERVPGSSWRERARSITTLNAVAPLVSAVGGVLAYFAYNGVVFGGVAPVSGATKQNWSRLLWEREGGYSFAQNLRDTLQFPVFRYEALLVAVGVCACLPLMWWLARRFRKPEDRLPLAYMTVMFGLAIGHLAKFAHTVLTMHPNLKSVSVWHYVPAYLMMALIVPAVCYVFIRIIRRSVGLRWGLASEVLSLGVVLAGAAFLFARADFAGPFRMVDRNIESIGYGRLNFRLSDYMGAQVINRALPDDSVIGSWDSGVVGYFSRFPVVNLDGLVNSYSFFHATSEASAWGYHKFKFKPPYREFGITHFANAYGVNRRDFALQYMGLPFDSNGRRLAFQIWSDAPLGDANASARFWEDMESRFDYRADGVGVIAAGRVAQAFAKDCAPDELVVWSWAGSGDGAESVAGSWVKSGTGLCMNAIALPRGALPPARAESMTPDDYLADLIGGRQAAVRSEFDVYLVDRRLIYLRERCAREDIEAAFFLHLYPVDVNDLPDHRKRHGYDNLDFSFDEQGFEYGGICLVDAPLPEYGIAEIRTGQFVSAEGGYERVWEGKMRLGE